MNRSIFLTLLLAAGAAHAQGVPHGPAQPPGPEGRLSPEALATAPDLNAQQQIEVRKILLQRRDAHDALRAKERAEREAAMTRSRSEHERIDDESSARLRKLLGDDGYRNLAQWLLPPGREGGPGRPRGPGMPGVPHPPLPAAPPTLGANDPAAPATPAPDADDDDAQARVR